MGPNGENLFPKEKAVNPKCSVDYEKNLEKLVVRLKRPAQP